VIVREAETGSRQLGFLSGKLLIMHPEGVLWHTADLQVCNWSVF
jgi:hypothetical protein